LFPSHDLEAESTHCATRPMVWIQTPAEIAKATLAALEKYDHKGEVK